MFWNTIAETLTKHRNPLMTGFHIGLRRTLTVDALHTLYLGVFNACCVHVAWVFIELIQHVVVVSRVGYMLGTDNVVPSDLLKALPV